MTFGHYYDKVWKSLRTGRSYSEGDIVGNLFQCNKQNNTWLLGESKFLLLSFMSHKEKVLFFIFLYREGSVIADFVVNFKMTGNATVLETAYRILKDSLNQSRNSSSFGEFLVDPAHAFLAGKM